MSMLGAKLVAVIGEIVARLDAYADGFILPALALLYGDLTALREGEGAQAQGEAVSCLCALGLLLERASDLNDYGLGEDLRA